MKNVIIKQKLQKNYTWLWVGWIAYFFTVEGIAVFNKKKGDTFSENARAFFGYTKDENGKYVNNLFYKIRRILWIILFPTLAVWLYPHIPKWLNW